jgi:hypothetical protein
MWTVSFKDFFLIFTHHEDGLFGASVSFDICYENAVLP